MVMKNVYSVVALAVCVASCMPRVNTQLSAGTVEELTLRVAELEAAMIKQNETIENLIREHTDTVGRFVSILDELRAQVDATTLLYMQFAEPSGGQS